MSQSSKQSATDAHDALNDFVIFNISELTPECYNVQSGRPLMLAVTLNVSKQLPVCVACEALGHRCS